MVAVEIDQTAIRALRKELNALEPGLANYMGREIKQSLNGVKDVIQARMPKQSPLSNLVRGQKVWSPSKVSLSVSAAAGFGKPMAIISAEGRPNPAMAKIVEFAGKGKKDYVSGNRGRALIRNLDARQSSRPKEGRYFFSAYRLRRPEMLQNIERVINKYIDIANRKFD
jgi:hypothetical protein